jgi:hypothetical protein
MTNADSKMLRVSLDQHEMLKAFAYKHRLKMHECVSLILKMGLVEANIKFTEK